MAVGRFQVMATLQAARAYVLGLELESAKSWGLNRAIFYAAAKKGFITARPGPPTLKIAGAKKGVEEIKKSFGVYHLGDEMAYKVEIAGKTFFTIGSEVQTPEHFAKEVESRFKGKFDEAFKEAVEIMKKYDKGVLMSQHYFYETVYKPRRDELAERWTGLTK
ncbi:MAG: hypothetical protein ABIK39_04160 [candidate division WOR-3 bacterium]